MDIKTKPNLFSIVIPVFNGEAAIEGVRRRISRVFKDIMDDYEIILIDDRSRDGSWEIMGKLCNSDPRVKIIQLMRNFGSVYTTMNITLIIGCR